MLEQRVQSRTVELQSRNRELETLDRIVQSINRELQPEKVYRRLLQHGGQLFPGLSRGVFIARQEDKSLRFAAMIGIQRKSLPTTPFKLPDLVASLPSLGTTLVPGALHLEKDGAHLLGQSLPQLSFEGELLLLLIPPTEPEGIIIWELIAEQADLAEQGPSLERFLEHAVSAVAKAQFLHTLQEKNAEIIRTQNQLVMQEKMASLGILTAGVAHELRNPLNFVNNFAFTAKAMLEELRNLLLPLIELQQTTYQDEFNDLLQNLEEGMGQVQFHGLRAEDIVARMLELAREGTLERREVNFNEWVQEFARLAFHAAQKHKQQLQAQLSFDLDPNLPLIKVNTRNFSRLIAILINNALEALLLRSADAAPDWRPVLRLSTKAEPNRMVLTLWDNGSGIEASPQEKIFTPFFTSKQGGDHIGLGLYIAYDIVVHEHGGSLTVLSQRHDWTQFTISLPLDPSPA